MWLLEDGATDELMQVFEGQDLDEEELEKEAAREDSLANWLYLLNLYASYRSLGKLSELVNLACDDLFVPLACSAAKLRQILPELEQDVQPTFAYARPLSAEQPFSLLIKCEEVRATSSSKPAVRLVLYCNLSWKSFA